MNTFGPHGKFRSAVRNTATRATEREFVRLFGPVVYALARKRGFGDEAAADLMHEVLMSTAQNERQGADEPKQDTIHTRLITATRVAMAAAFNPDTTPGLDADWAEEFQRQLAANAMSVVKREFSTRDWEVFWKVVIEGQTGTAVGRKLGLTSGAVQIVKYRVLARLREEVHRLRLDAESWDGNESQIANQSEVDAAQGPNRSRPTPASSSCPTPDHDTGRTSLYVPCHLR